MIGILVYGDNHFIVDGPAPTASTAKALAQHWSIIRIGNKPPPELAGWKIISKAYREHLEWAVVVEADSEILPSVRALLAELDARGIPSTHGNAD